MIAPLGIGADQSVEAKGAQFCPDAGDMHGHPVASRIVPHPPDRLQQIASGERFALRGDNFPQHGKFARVQSGPAIPNLHIAVEQIELRWSRLQVSRQHSGHSAGRCALHRTVQRSYPGSGITIAPLCASNRHRSKSGSDDR